jgi:hypothetical protein
VSKKCGTRTVIMQDADRWWRIWFERMSDCHMVYPSLYTNEGGYCTQCGTPAPPEDLS